MALGLNLRMYWGVCAKGGAIGVELKLNKVENLPIIEVKVATCAYKKSFIWNSSQSSKGIVKGAP